MSSASKSISLILAGFQVLMFILTRRYLDTKVVENRDGRHLNFFLKDSSALSEALTAFAEIVVARLSICQVSLKHANSMC